MKLLFIIVAIFTTNLVYSQQSVKSIIDYDKFSNYKEQKQ